jgi:hypothetical protein
MSTRRGARSASRTTVGKNTVGLSEQSWLQPRSPTYPCCFSQRTYALAEVAMGKCVKEFRNFKKKKFILMLFQNMATVKNVFEPKGHKNEKIPAPIYFFVFSKIIYSRSENNILEQLGTTLEQPETTFKIVFFPKVGANLTHSVYRVKQNK